MKDPFRIDTEINTIFHLLHDACSIHVAIHSLQLNSYLESLGLPPEKVSVRKQLIEYTLNALVDRRTNLLKQAIRLLEEYNPDASSDRPQSSSPAEV